MPGPASSEESIRFVKICFKGPGFNSAYVRNFLCSIKITFDLMYDFDSSTIYEANTGAIFPLNEKIVNIVNIEQPEEMGHSSTDAM